MINQISKVFFIFFASIICLTSCSSDDDNKKNNDNNSSSNTIVELPENDLGTYKGVLFSDTINNGDAIVTLSKSGDKSYTADFNDDIASIADVQFIAAPDSVPNNIFSTTVDALNNRGIAFTLIDDNEGNRSLTITQEIGNNTITFTGRLQ